MFTTLFARLLLVSMLVLLACLPTSSTSAAVSTTLARGTLPSIPAGDFIMRSIDLTLEATAPPHTHMHGAGMNYALFGPHLLTLDGTTTTLEASQAAWIGETARHSHGTNGTTASRWLFVLVLRPASERGALAPPVPGRTARIGFDSEVMRFTDRGAQEVILVVDAYHAGEASAMQTYAGPTLFFVEVGTVTLETGTDSRRLQTGDYGMVQPGTPVQVQTDGSGNARVLALSVIPAGQPRSAPVPAAPAPAPAPVPAPALVNPTPPALPNTGEVIQQPVELPNTGQAGLPMPVLVLATILLLGGIAVRRHRMRGER